MSDANARDNAFDAARALPATEAVEPDDSHDWQPGSLVFDRFVVEKEIGRGGMGIVYLVRGVESGQRYAVKTSRQLDQHGQQCFLREIAAWQQLPDHPNLVRCHFFKSLSRQVVAFAEFIDGIALDQQIRRGGNSPDWILEVAIQTAEGLAAAHRAGIVHRDVKPANVLLAKDGTARITDFGIAYARNQALLLPGQREPAGMTRAYRSPEQARGDPTDEKTDQWSWAVSVLQMQVGKLTWQTGEVASVALEDFVRTRATSGMPVPVPGLTSILRRCLQTNANQRWSSMAAVVVELSKLYRLVTGKSYVGPLVIPTIRPQRAGASASRLDLRDWWRQLRENVGPEFPFGDRELPIIDGDSLVSSLSLLDQLRIFLERQVRFRGRADLTRNLADASWIQAHIQERLGDSDGAAVLYDITLSCLAPLSTMELAHAAVLVDAGVCRQRANQLELARLHTESAVRTFERSLQRNFDRRIAVFLIEARMNLAVVVARRGQVRHALDLLSQAQDLLESLIAEQSDTDLLDRLGRLCRNRAFCHEALGEFGKAIEENDIAIEFFEQIAAFPLPAALEEIATTHLNQANCLRAVGRLTEADTALERVVRILTELIAGGRVDLEGPLAHALSNQAALLEKLDQPERGLKSADRSIVLFEHVIDRSGHFEHELQLSEALGNKALMLLIQGSRAEAEAVLSRAQRICQRIAASDAQREGSLGLAAVRERFAESAWHGRDSSTALDAFTEAIELRESAALEDRSADERYLARAYSHRAIVLLALGRFTESQSDLDRALRVQEQLVIDQSRMDCLEDFVTSRLTQAELFRTTDRPMLALEECRQVEQLLAGNPRLPPLRHAALYARTFERIAFTYKHLGDLAAALQAIDRAVDVLEKSAAAAPLDLMLQLANLYNSRGTIQSSMGSEASACASYELALRLLATEGGTRHDSRIDDAVARACLNQAIALLSTERFDQAIPLLDRCIALRSQLRSSDLLDLLRARALRALAWDGSGDPESARAEARAVIAQMREIESAKAVEANAIASLLSPLVATH